MPHYDKVVTPLGTEYSALLLLLSVIESTCDLLEEFRIHSHWYTIVGQALNGFFFILNTATVARMSYFHHM